VTTGRPDGRSPAAEEAAPVEDPIVDGPAARLEVLRTFRVVEDHRVDDDVRLEGQDLLEHLVEGREVRSPARAVEDLPAAIAGRVQARLEPARGGVVLLDALPLRERVPEEHDPDDPRCLGPELALAEERDGPELDREGRPCRNLVHAGHAPHGVFTADLRPSQVDVEIAARIARVAVQEQALARPVELARCLRSRRCVAEEAQAGLRDQRGGHQ
jgi:hypothetical protein